MVSRSFAKPTDLQLKKPLLCRHCEEKFCKFGEDYSLSMVNRNGTFKALDMVTAAPPRLKEGNFYTYFGTDVGLDMDALGYFAVSTIWRGAVASWHTSSRTAEAVIPLLCASSR